MQYHLYVQKLHSRYGDFVRTGPRELTVLRASAVELVYGPSSKCTKGTWYDQNSGNPDKVGIENVRDKERHRVRRKAWDQGLGSRGMSLNVFTAPYPSGNAISLIPQQLSGRTRHEWRPKWIS